MTRRPNLSPWARNALSFAALETIHELASQGTVLVMVGDSPRGKWKAWVRDYTVTPPNVERAVDGWDAEDVAMRALTAKEPA